MLHPKKKFTVVIFILVTTIIFSTSCKSAKWLIGTEEEEVLWHSIYEIDYDSILIDLQNGNTSSIHLFNDTNEYPPENGGREDLSWNWEEYFLIAKSIHKLEWDESLDGWQVGGIQFRGSCVKLGQGYDYARFEFYKEVEEGKNIIRYSSTVFIFPGMNIIEADGKKFTSIISNKTGISFNDLKLSPDEALNIAEENGGENTRTELQNNCDFLVYLGKSWIISYSDPEKTIEYYYVNPTNGILLKKE